jgi:hypothetical protein
MKDKYSVFREIYKNDDWVFGVGGKVGCSQVFDIDTKHPQPFSYLDATNPDDFRMATADEIAEANRKFDNHLRGDE